MSKAPRITPEIERMISEIFLKNPGIKAKDARKKLLMKMRDKELDKIFGPDFPREGAISNRLRQLRVRAEERSTELTELDQPWSFATLKKYPIPSYDLPFVSSVWELCQKEGYPHYVLTIREALWAGRLYKIIEKTRSKYPQPETESQLALEYGFEGTEIPLENIVLEWASEYAFQDEMSEIEGQPYDTEDVLQLDFHIMHSVFENFGNKRHYCLEIIEDDYEIEPYLVKELDSLNLTLGQIATAATLLTNNDIRIFRVSDKKWVKHIYNPKLPRLWDDERGWKQENVQSLGGNQKDILLAVKEGYSDNLLQIFEPIELWSSVEAKKTKTSRAEY
jgi:hypothetical protein